MLFEELLSKILIMLMMILCIIVFKSDDRTPDGKARTIVHRIIDIENNESVAKDESSTRVIRTKAYLST